MANRAADAEPTFKLRLLRIAVRSASLLLPNLTAGIIYRLWFKTFRHATPAREQVWIAQATRVQIAHGAGRLNAWLWGETQCPRVLLVHGWNGRGSQMGAFAQPLLAAGFGVVALDLPGHGDSSGNSSNLLISADALHAAQRAWGPFVAVIGHSFGAAASVLAMSQDFGAQKIISISMPQNVRWLLQIYCQMLGVSARVEHKVQHKIEQALGADIWQRLKIERIVAKFNAPGLVVHDRRDDAVPYTQAEHIVRSWRSATLLATDGLGHYRIIRAPEVIAAAIDFIRTAD